MRRVVDAGRVRRFMHELGKQAGVAARVYFTGGATAVLVGWRETTIDLDIKVVPDADPLLRLLPRLKEELELNVELASPVDFIPVPPGWEERSPFVAREGLVDFHHFDLYAQAMAKLERGHTQDLADVEEMVRRGLIDPHRALEYFARLEPGLYRYPAVDPRAFRRAVEEAFGAPPRTGQERGDRG